jgi:hypothetical protein
MKGATMRRIPVLLLAALLMIGLMPIAASAATAQETAAIVALEEALDGLECITPEGCVEELAEVNVALGRLKALFPELDYSELDGARAGLGDLLTGGDVEEPTPEEITALVDAVQAAGAAVVADATAAADEEDTTTTTIAEVVTDIPDGGSGPNVAMLGAAALLVLLASAALALRASVDRR